MSVLKFPLLFVGSKAEKHLYTLFDSGANLSCINPDSIDAIADKQLLGRIRKLATASEGHYRELKYRVSVDFTSMTFC